MISLSIDRVSCIWSDLSKQPNRMDRTPRGVLGPRGRETQRSNRIEPTLPHAHAGARQVNPDRVQVASSGLRGSDTSPFPPWHLESTIYRCIEPSRLLAWGSGQIGTLVVAKAIKPFHHGITSGFDPLFIELLGLLDRL